MKYLPLIPIIYLLMAIFTFGHAASHCEKQTYHVCDSGDRSFRGMASAMVWPMYWSWELQE